MRLRRNEPYRCVSRIGAKENGEKKTERGILKEGKKTISIFDTIFDYFSHYWVT